jgi:hypothetical protein
VLPVKRLAVRWAKKNSQVGHTFLISTLEPRDVLRLLGRPERDASVRELVALAYAEFYDRRGAIKIEIKEAKSGLGMTKRRKKRGGTGRFSRFCVSGDNQPISLERTFDYATD